jgi:hypothetical protein
MPPVVLWALGAVSAAVVAKWLAREARRVNDELDAVRTQSAHHGRGKHPHLERDPETGIYRPGRANS